MRSQEVKPMTVFLSNNRAHHLKKVWKPPDAPPWIHAREQGETEVGQFYIYTFLSFYLIICIHSFITGGKMCKGFYWFCAPLSAPDYPRQTIPFTRRFLVGPKVLDYWHWNSFLHYRRQNVQRWERRRYMEESSINIIFNNVQWKGESMFASFPSWFSPS